LYIFYEKNQPKEYFRQLNNLSSTSNNNNNNITNNPMSDSPVTYKYPLLQTQKAQQKLEYTPIIYPRSHDGDVWSLPSYTHSAVNSDNMRYNLTEEYEPLNYQEEFNPRIDYYRDDVGLQNVNTYCMSQNGNRQLSQPVQSNYQSDQIMGNVDWNQQYGTRIPPTSPTSLLPTSPTGSQSVSQSVSQSGVDWRQRDSSNNILNPSNLRKTTDYVAPPPKDVDTSTPLIKQQRDLGPSSLYKEKYSAPADWSIPVNTDKTPISYISERFFGFNKHKSQNKPQNKNKFRTQLLPVENEKVARSLHYVTLRAD
jgi:hypothetical protein